MECIEEAMEYIKGYCNKHVKCEDNCRLFNEETDQCFLLDGCIPCDWDIKDNEESE